MEIKAELKKPYEEEQRIEFIVEQNHKLGYEIRETGSALEAWGFTEQEIVQKERERLDMLSLTAADVERAIYKDKGMDFEDVLELVERLTLTPSLSGGEGVSAEIDIKALKIELKANNFYRGNPYVEAIGNILGYSSEDLDYLFEHKELPEKVEEPIAEETNTQADNNELESEK